MSTQRSAPRAGVTALEDAVFALIGECGGLEPGELVVHFDLVASTRRIERGQEQIERRHWCTPGADPHTSYGVLDAQASKILRHVLT